MADADVGDLALFEEAMADHVTRPLSLRSGEQFDRRIHMCQIVFGLSYLRLIGLDPAEDLGAFLRQRLHYQRFGHANIGTNLSPQIQSAIWCTCYRGSKGPLHLLVDSTGIKVEGEGEWHARKHGGPKRRVWRKLHLGIDEETLEIRAVEVTGSHIGDAPILPHLLDQIPQDQEIGSVTADGAYDTRKCHDAIADRGAHAVIPPRKNAKPWKTITAGAVARNEALRAAKYLGRALWRRWSGYHRRSRVETKMHCIKLLGQRLMARDFNRQVAELQVRIAVLNGYTALGIPVTEAVG